MANQQIGPNVVYKPPEGEIHELDIVLVHGIFGHAKKSWTKKVPQDREALADDVSSDEDCPTQMRSKKTSGKRNTEPRQEIFWPRDLLPKVLPQARIITWGYDVQIENIFSSASQASIFHHAQTLLSDLIMIRPCESDKKRPLIFIAHSLGGIVVKDALSLSRNDFTQLQEILPATLGVMFLGTPHHGSKTASLGKLAFEVSKMFFQKPNLDVLRGLERNSEILDRITRGFGQVLAASSLKVHSFREELDTKGVKIVDSFSSTIGYLYETTGTLHANHREMAKMSSLEDIKFRRVVSVLKTWIERGSSPEMMPQTTQEIPSLPDGLIFDEEYQKCLQSLDFFERRSRFDDVDIAFRNTYEWIFDPKLSFRSWLSGLTPSSKFWIQGKPGSGKSTLMKFAKNHPLTRQILGQYHSGLWIIAAYFFHDRGTEAQKSISGFLREIIYQILDQEKRLFPVIYKVFCRQNKSLQATTRTNTEKGDNLKTFRDSIPNGDWSLVMLQDALLALAANATFDVNICIFVDALDEHDGNHRDLLSLLDRLTGLNKNKYFRLQLCLAGRQENVFRAAFRDCPGFVMHDHTPNDIRQYTKGRLQNAVSADLTEDGELALSGLVEEIIDRAEGVFLWVRLVIDELIEGLCEGDSMQELKDLLSGLPTELEELYTRALCRPNRSRIRPPADFKYERYVMFQIVLCGRNRFTLFHLLAAASFLTTGREMYPELEKLSHDQQARRLHSRSAGLLEEASTAVSYHNRRMKDINSEFQSSIWQKFPYHELKVAPVQFIHQTVKDYVTTGPGKTMITQDIGEEGHESGFISISIFRYLISILAASDEKKAHLDRSFAVVEFSYYARIIERGERETVGFFLEPVISKVTEAQQSIVLVQILATEDLLEAAEAAETMEGRRWPQLLFFYAVLHFDRSLVRFKQRYIDGLTTGERRLVRVTSFDFYRKIFCRKGLDENARAMSRVNQMLQDWDAEIRSSARKVSPIFTA